MAISNYVPNSRISQAGVIPNAAARPASPYEGQLVYQQDDNALYIYDGSNWVKMVSASNPPALEYIKSGTLSGSTKDFTGCFSATYDNYLINIDSIQVNSAADIYWQLLSGSTPSATGYDWGYLGYQVNTGVANSNNANSILGYTGITISSINATIASGSLQIFAPFKVARTHMVAQSFSYFSSNWGTRMGGSHHDNAASYDGIRFTTGGAATFTTGSVRIYGYRN